MVPLSIGFSQQEYQSGLPFPHPGDFPNPGIKPMSFVSLALAGGFFITAPPGKHLHCSMCVCVCVCMCAKSLKSCLTLCDPMDHCLPGPAAHGILQARILEWVAMPSSRRSSQPRDRTHVSYISCIGRWLLYHSCYLGSLHCSIRLDNFKKCRLSAAF